MDMQADQTIITRLKSWWRQRLETIAEMDQIRALDSRQIADVAQDCGVSAARLVAIVRAGRHGADEMIDMMRVLDIDPVAVEEADRLLFRDMQATCATCTSKKQCKYDIEDGRAERDHAEYCGNADLLDALRVTPDMRLAH